MIKRLMTRLAVSFLRRRSEHMISSDARLVWLWVEQVRRDGPNGEPGIGFETITSPAYN